MWKMKFLEQFNPITPPNPDTGRSPFTHPVHRQNGRILERRRNEGAGGMGLVMAGIDKCPFIARQLIPHSFGEKQLILEPNRYSPKEGRESGWRQGEVSLKKSVKFSKGVFIKGHVVQAPYPDSSFFQAIIHHAGWKRFVVLLAGEPLLLGRSRDPTVYNECSSRVMVKR